MDYTDVACSGPFASIRILGYIYRNITTQTRPEHAMLEAHSPKYARARKR